MTKGKVKQAERKTKQETVEVETLGGRLRAFRLEMNFTAEEFASDVYMDEDVLVSIEDNSIEPSIRMLRDLAIGADCDLHYLITGRPSDLYCRCYIAYPNHSKLTISQRE